MNVIDPCEGCGKLAPRKWCDGGAWLCVDCLPPAMKRATCRICVAVGPYGIERFALMNAGGDDYALGQGLAFVCSNNHLNLTATQWGPGAGEKAGQPA